MQNHLLSVNEPARAAVFVNRCDAKQRVDLYIKCNDWVKAANEVRAYYHNRFLLYRPGPSMNSAKIAGIKHA